MRKLHTLSLFINEGLILVPFDEASVFDTMLSTSGCGSNSTNLEGGFGREELQCAIEAGSDTGQDNSCLALEALVGNISTPFIS